MEHKLNLKQWIANFDAGAFDVRDIQTQCRAGWYDWFCQDKSLASRLQKLAPKVKAIAKSAKVDSEKMYVFFKNNCPCYSKLYDDFRICDMQSGDVIWTIIPASGHTCNAGTAELWGRENEFNGPLVIGKMKDIYAYFGL